MAITYRVGLLVRSRFSGHPLSSMAEESLSTVAARPLFVSLAAFNFGSCIGFEFQFRLYGLLRLPSEVSL